MCDFYPEETATIWQVTYQKARRAHRCDACRSAITPGQSYRLTKSLFDGHWSTEKACTACSDALSRFGEAHRFTPSASNFREYLTECTQWDDEWDEPETVWATALRELNERLAQAEAKK